MENANTEKKRTRECFCHERQPNETTKNERQSVRRRGSRRREGGREAGTNGRTVTPQPDDTSRKKTKVPF